MNRKEERLAPLIFLAVIVILLVSVIIFNQLKSIPNGTSVGVSVSDFQLAGVKGINSSGSTFVIQFEITDSTPIGGTVERAAYFLYGDDHYIGRGILDQPVSVPSHTTVSAESNLLVPASGGLQGAWSYFLEIGAVSWLAIGNATLNEPILGTFVVHFSCSTTSGSGPVSCSYVLL